MTKPENMTENELLIAWGRTVLKQMTDPKPLTDRENAIYDEMVARGYDEDSMDDYALLTVQEVTA